MYTCMNTSAKKAIALIPTFSSFFISLTSSSNLSLSRETVYIYGCVLCLWCVVFVVCMCMYETFSMVLFIFGCLLVCLCSVFVCVRPYINQCVFIQNLCEKKEDEQVCVWTYLSTLIQDLSF